MGSWCKKCGQTVWDHYHWGCDSRTHAMKNENAAMREQLTQCAENQQADSADKWLCPDCGQEFTIHHYNDHYKPCGSAADAG